MERRLWLLYTNNLYGNSSYPLLLQPSGGNVGIGNDNPKTKLHVKNNGETFRVEGTDHTFISFYEGSDRVGYMGCGDSNDDFFRINTDHTDTGLKDLYLEASNVGIGIHNPRI